VATSLLGQEFCEGKFKESVELTALPFSSPHRFYTATGTALVDNHVLYWEGRWQVETIL